MADAPKILPLRTLIINMMFSGFVSLVVFVVGTYFFIIPRLYDHERRVQELEESVAAMSGSDEEVTDDEDAAVDEAAGGAPAPAAAPAAAPPAPDAGR